MLFRLSVPHLPQLLALALLPLWSPTSVEAVPVKSVSVTAISPQANISLIRPGSFSQNLLVDQQIKNGDTIEVPAGKAWAQLKSRQPNLEAKIVGLPSHKGSWRLPCTFKGSGFIAWTGGGRPGCAPPAVKILGSSSDQSWLPLPAPSIASADPRLPLQTAQGLSLISVCSAMDEEGDHANTVVSLAQDPCSKAVEECEQAVGTAGTCMVVSEGKWSPESVVFSECGNRLKKLTDWQAIGSMFTSLFGDANGCILHVLAPGDALLRPEDGSRTAIAFEPADRGTLVTVLEGAIRIVSTRSSKWQPLTTGETFLASRGRMRSREEGLESSELCQSTLEVADLPEGQGPEAARQQELTDDAVNFDQLASTYCQFASGTATPPPGATPSGEIETQDRREASPAKDPDSPQPRPQRPGSQLTPQ